MDVSYQTLAGGLYRGAEAVDPNDAEYNALHHGAECSLARARVFVLRYWLLLQKMLQRACGVPGRDE